MKSDCVFAEIIDDDVDKDKDENENKTVISLAALTPLPKKHKTSSASILACYLNVDPSIIEIGVDEAGRGPLFGRVYTAAVILPKDGSFDCTMVKDSKKYHSKKKIDAAAEYVKQHSLAWCVTWEDEKTIDNINILQATQQSMHTSILGAQKVFEKKVFENVDAYSYSYHLLIDGNYFKPIVTFNKATCNFDTTPYTTVESGDNTYASIAAASILAKVSRDNYIEELCAEHPELSLHYSIDSNKGYGAKKHIDGIKQHGITIWHRRSFAPCKHYIV